MTIAERFREFLPIVVDVETGGLNPAQHPMLEVAAMPLTMDAGRLAVADTWHYHLIPHPGLPIEPSAAKITKYTADNTDTVKREAEPAVLTSLAARIKATVANADCRQAILVGHNAAFDLEFLKAGYARHGLPVPFHPFCTLDTATVGAFFYGHTVLATLCERAGLGWQGDTAHEAWYDCAQTAELFCTAYNRLQGLMATEQREPANKAPRETP